MANISESKTFRYHWVRQNSWISWT